MYQSQRVATDLTVLSIYSDKTLHPKLHQPKPTLLTYSQIQTWPLTPRLFHPEQGENILLEDDTDVISTQYITSLCM